MIGSYRYSTAGTYISLYIIIVQVVSPAKLILHARMPSVGANCKGFRISSVPNERSVRIPAKGSLPKSKSR